MKNVIKMILLIVLTIAILITCSNILLLKSEDGISQMQSFYKQKNGTIDVLFLGSSHVFCDISTGLLWDDYGIASYDLGGAEAPSWTSYYHLKEVLNSQKPEVIFYEISIAAIRPTEYPPEFWVEDNNYGMKWNNNRIQSLKENTLEKTFPKIFFPLSAMHGRYKELTKNDFINKNNSINYKGFDPREAVTPFETPDISAVTNKTPCSDKAEKYLRKIIELCRDEDIPLVLFVSPYVVKDEEQEMYNYMFAIGEEYGVPYIDFNKYYEDFGMDFSTDMAEELHLNYSGNEKFTRYFGKVIKDRYDIPDRRGNANYASWSVDAHNQRMERYSLNIMNSDSFDDVADIISKDDARFMLFINIGSKYDVDNLDLDDHEGLWDIGFDSRYVEPGTVLISENDEIVASYKNQNVDYSIENGNDRIKLKKEIHEDEDLCKTTLNISGDIQEFDEDKFEVFVYDTVRSCYVGSLSL